MGASLHNWKWCGRVPAPDLIESHFEFHASHCAWVSIRYDDPPI